MADHPPRPARVVLRYEDSWPELLAQLAVDRAAGLTASAARDLLLGFCDPGTFDEIGVFARREARSYDAAPGEGDAGVPGAGDPGAPGAGRDDGPRAEIDVPCDGLIAGWGARRGRTVFLVADDPALGGPVRGGAAAAKASRVRGHALAQGGPLVQLYATRRLAEGAFLGAEFARYGYGVDVGWESASVAMIPKVAVVNGPLVAQAAFEASWAHLVVLAGPAASLQLVDGAALSGDEALRAGLADAQVDSPADALRLAGAFLDLLPSSSWDEPPPAAVVAPRDAPGPAASPAEVASLVVDDASLLALRPGYAAELLTGLARLAGTSIGLAALPSDGALSARACVKLSRLVRLCETFRLPLVVVQRGAELGAAEREGVDRALTLREDLSSLSVPVLDVGLAGARLPRVLGAPVAFAGVWRSDDGAGRAGIRAVGAASPADETFAPAATREVLAEALAALPVTRREPWQDPRVNQERDQNLFSRTAD